MAGKKCFCVCTVVLLVIISTLISVLTIHLQKLKTETFKHAAVAADSETCSGVGRDMLLANGSAVDAAIAALLCTSVINPQSMGLGGGAIFTIKDKNGIVKIISSRETVPQMFKADLLSKCPCSEAGTQWMGVPGEIRGYERVHHLYGRLPWAKLFEPTIRLAREGVKISNIVARYLPKIRRHTIRELFEDKDGNLLKEGDTVKFEKLAQTLERISKNGADEFYTGDTGRKLICDVQEAGGSLTLEDLRSAEVTEMEPWTVSLGDYTMYFPPPPAGGALVSFILNVMKGYNPNQDSIKGKERILTYHRFIEASKFANAKRKLMRDPRFDSGKKTVQEAFAITQEEFADRIKKIIDYSTNEVYNATEDKDTGGTSHVSILDEEGMAVSVTSSINYLFGSQVYSPKTGIILNNHLLDFCEKTDRIQTGERPPSSMAPMILFSNSKNHTVVIGGAGGSKITTGVTLTLMNHLWFGKSLKDSISAPVVHLYPDNTLFFEPDFNKDVMEALRIGRSTVKDPELFISVVNALSQKDGVIEAYSDARKLGKAVGY
ncbi:glutathione hydrolase 5 proenzyme-like [Hoplias malabaricus]|uniref:glutathione hydrolase 5 proenzyme-like n=1 Tax=Hoplias malabaricus TaxID=27720 RepID=UPI0034619F42